MKKASEYLTPEHTHGRRSEKITKRMLQKENERLQTHGISGIMHDRPQFRAECPTERPCPYVGCRYNNFIEIGESGNIRLSLEGIDAWERRHSCALDMADLGPQPTNVIADATGLTRTRINQILRDAQVKLKDIGFDLMENIKYDESDF